MVTLEGDKSLLVEGEDAEKEYSKKYHQLTKIEKKKRLIQD